MSVPELRSHPARHAGAHSRRAHIDHHRHLQFVDNFEKRIETPVIHRKMPDDRMEVKSQHAEFPNGPLCLTEGLLTLEGVDSRPRLDDALRAGALHRGDEAVWAGGRGE